MSWRKKMFAGLGPGGPEYYAREGLPFIDNMRTKAADKYLYYIIDDIQVELFNDGTGMLVALATSARDKSRAFRV